MIRARDVEGVGECRAVRFGERGEVRKEERDDPVPPELKAAEQELAELEEYLKANPGESRAKRKELTKPDQTWGEKCPVLMRCPMKKIAKPEAISARGWQVGTASSIQEALHTLARQGYERMVLRQALAGVRVGDVMIRDPETVPPDMTLEELVFEGFLRTGYHGFPGVEGGRVVGLVSLRDVVGLSSEERASRRVASAMTPLSPELCIDSSTPLLRALERLATSRHGRLLVTSGDRVTGLVTKDGVARFVEMRALLQGPREAGQERRFSTSG